MTAVSMPRSTTNTEEIDSLLQFQIPGDAYFKQLGIYNYHGGGNVLFNNESFLNWITSVCKTEDTVAHAAADPQRQQSSDLTQYILAG